MKKKKTGEMKKMTTSRIYYEYEGYDWEPKEFDTYKGMEYRKIAEEIVEYLSKSFEFEFENGEVVELELFNELDTDDRLSLGTYNVVVQHTTSYTAYPKNP